jgi:hypothetical protein
MQSCDEARIVRQHRHPLLDFAGGALFVSDTLARPSHSGHEPTPTLMLTTTRPTQRHAESLRAEAQAAAHAGHLGARVLRDGRVAIPRGARRTRVSEMRVARRGECPVLGTGIVTAAWNPFMRMEQRARTVLASSAG